MVTLIVVPPPTVVREPSSLRIVHVPEGSFRLLVFDAYRMVAFPVGDPMVQVVIEDLTLQPYHA